MGRDDPGRGVWAARRVALASDVSGVDAPGEGAPRQLTERMKGARAGVGERRRRGERPARDEVEVEPHAESWPAGREGDGLGDRRRVHHHGRGRERAGVVGLDDAAIDAGGESQIVGVDDEYDAHRGKI